MITPHSLLLSHQTISQLLQHLQEGKHLCEKSIMPSWLSKNLSKLWESFWKSKDSLTFTDMRPPTTNVDQPFTSTSCFWSWRISRDRDLLKWPKCTRENWTLRFGNWDCCRVILEEVKSVRKRLSTLKKPKLQQISL